MLFELGFRQNGVIDTTKQPKTFDTVESFGKTTAYAYDEEHREWTVKGHTITELEEELVGAGFTHAVLE